jgi:hypothetical protein
MTGKDREITNLFGQHEAIRAQMKFLFNSLQKLAIQPKSALKEPAQVKEWLQNYCYALRDLRDGVYEHIELDERIFKALSSSVKNRRLATEHNNIKQQIDYAVQVVEGAVNTVTNIDELHRYASEIKTYVEKIRKLVETHTAKEDRLLKPQ